MRIKWDLEGLNKLKRGLEDYSSFSKEMERTAKEIASELRKMIKDETPVGETRRLKNGWVGQFEVTKTIGGFRVEFGNKVEYARAVNYGHSSHNQFNKGGEPYFVHHRVKVPTPYPQQNPVSPQWVYGWFFVENSIVTMADNPKLDKIIINGLRRWWRGCCGG